MILELNTDYQDETCTLSVLHVNGKTFHTIERPWIPNEFGGKSGKKYESCIGPGEYKLAPHQRPNGDKVWALINPQMDVYYLPSDVPKGRENSARTLVLIHAANFVYDVIGCIGPGKFREKVNGSWMIKESRAAMNELRQMLHGKVELSIVIRRPQFQ